jgi:hypothetical protein
MWTLQKSMFNTNKSVLSVYVFVLCNILFFGGTSKVGFLYWGGGGRENLWVKFWILLKIFQNL